MTLDPQMTARFAANLKALRCSKMLTIEQLAMEMKQPDLFPIVKLDLLEHGLTEPTVAELVAICDHFNEGLDFLLYHKASVTINWQ